MSVPEPDIEEAPWVVPPPGRPPRSPWHGRLLALVVLVLGGGALGVMLLGGEPGPAPDVIPAEAADEPAAAPADEPVETVDPAEAELAELRASDRYLMFAEPDRAIPADEAHTSYEIGWGAFAERRQGEIVHEWTNKAELWAQVVLPIRDELLLRGEPYSEPLWDEGKPVSASLGSTWSNETTGGRGQYIELNGVYFDEERNGPVEVVWAVLIARQSDGSGEVVAEMPPMEIVPQDAEGFMHSRQLIRRATQDWVETQPVFDDAGGR